MKLLNIKWPSRQVWGAVIVVAVVAVIVVMSALSQSSQNDTRLKVEADSLYNVALRHLTTSRYTEAYASLSVALQHYEQLDDTLGVTQTRVKLSSLFMGMEQYDEAAQMLNEAHGHVDFVEPGARMTYYRVRAIMATQLHHDYSAAERYIRQAIKLEWERTDTAKVLADMGNLAEIFVNSGSYAQALEVVDSIHVLGQGTNRRVHLPQMFLCKGRALYGQERYGAAYAALDSSQRIARGFHLLNIEVDALRMLAKMDSLLGDEHAYIQHFGDFVALRDTLNGSQTTYRLGQRKAQVRIMQMRHDEQRRHYRLILSVVSLALLLTLAISAVTILWMYYRRSRQNEVIARQDAELIAQQMHLSQLENELLELRLQKGREQLSQTTDELSRANKENLSMSLQLASAQPGGKKSSLKSFDDIFKKVDRHFVELLLQRYPRITKTEQRLACLIKLNMSSHEIVAAMAVSSDSLYKMRYRLRKKLNLTPDDDLDNFIRTLS